MAHSTCSLNIVLVIIFCHVEFVSELNLCCNRLANLFLLLLYKFLCLLKLIFIYCPNSASILSAIVGTLSVHLGWVMHQEESLEQLPVCNKIRIVNDFDCLCMHCISLANFPIIWILCPPLLIPRFSCENSWSLLKSMLYPPEASASEICNLIPLWSGMISTHT